MLLTLCQCAGGDAPLALKLPENSGLWLMIKVVEILHLALVDNMSLYAFSPFFLLPAAAQVPR